MEAWSTCLSATSGRMTLVVNPCFNFCKRDDGFEDGNNESKSGKDSWSQSVFSWVEVDEDGVVSIAWTICWETDGPLGSGTVLRLIKGIRGESAK